MNFTGWHFPSLWRSWKFTLFQLTPSCCCTYTKNSSQQITLVMPVWGILLKNCSAPQFKETTFFHGNYILYFILLFYFVNFFTFKTASSGFCAVIWTRQNIWQCHLELLELWPLRPWVSKSLVTIFHLSVTSPAISTHKNSLTSKSPLELK